MQVACDECPDIQANYIEQPETCALRNADQRTCQEVDFLDCVVSFDHGFVDGGSEEAADSIGDEIRRVFTDDNALPEPPVTELRDEADHFHGCVCAWDDFG